MTTSNSTEANKALVLEGIKGVFIERDATVVDRLFSPDYRQHNPQIPNGSAAIKGLLGNLSRDFNVFLVGDTTLATFPAHVTPKFATSAHIAFASLNQLVTQISWIKYEPK